MKFSDLENKKVAIWGLGVEGQAILDYLKELYPNKDIKVIDNDIVPQGIDVIIRSPGVSIYKENIKKAIQEGIRFTSLMNLFLGEINSQANKPKVIVVTGTKGKSTTTSLMAFMLEKLGYKVGLGGNIGLTPLEFLGKKLDYIVLELSSFQISDLVEEIDIATVINLSRAHVDWHLTYDAYIADKLRILKLAKETILNYADDYLKTLELPNNTFYNVKEGFHVKEGTLYDGKEVIELPELQIVGEHNLSNIAACFTMLSRLGLEYKKIVGYLGEFESLAHRLQKVYEKDGLTFVDDSIATVPESVMAAINSFKGQDIALIIGGYDNGQMDYGKLSTFVENAKDVKVALCLPDTGSMLKTSKSVAVKNMSEAVKRAKKAINKGVVLLSPAAPSFNMYKNYKERGLDFARLSKEV